MAPASTGRERSRRIVVIKIDQANRGICSIFIFFGRMLMIVVIKLIDPMIDLTPARCKLKIAISIAELLWKREEDKGG